MASKRQNTPQRGEVWDVDFNPIIKSTVQDIRSELLTIENDISAIADDGGSVTECLQRLVKRLHQTIDDLSEIGAEINKIRPRLLLASLHRVNCLYILSYQ